MKIRDLIDNINKKNRYIIPLTQGLLTIALVIAVSVISVHLLMGSTLSDYAEANPEKAYGVTKEPIEETERSGDTVQNATESPSGDTDNSGEINSNSEQSFAAGSNLPEYNRSVKIHFYDPDDTSYGSSDTNASDRTTYAPGFYYEPLSAEMKEYITGVSYPVSVLNKADVSGASENSGEEDSSNKPLNTIEGTPAVSYDELRYVGILYYDLNGLIQAGELICNEYIAEDLTEIFNELYKSEYRIESVFLIDNFSGDDTASMCADNTSCFNYRVVDGTTSLSKHARGLAIDINPFYNPYIVFGKGEGGSDYISPPGSEIYADRSASFAYKIDENDLCYRLFKAHGFVWGGDWNSCKDYQHFQKVP